MIVLLAVLAWAVPAAAVLCLLAAGRRRRDAQARYRHRALNARQAAARTPSWARTERHRRHR